MIVALKFIVWEIVVCYLQIYIRNFDFTKEMTVLSSVDSTSKCKNLFLHLIRLVLQWFIAQRLWPHTYRA